VIGKAEETQERKNRRDRRDPVIGGSEKKLLAAGF